MDAKWTGIQTIQNRVFICGYCGAKISSDDGFRDQKHSLSIWICPCGSPTFFDGAGRQYPGTSTGRVVEGIDEEQVSELYEEARRCTSAQGYTAAVLACRKLLMHIAVEKGAEAGKPFIEYVEYLSEKHYIPPDAKTWVDEIRKRGNEANHEIKIMSFEEAEEILSFTEMLLRVIYEFPSKIKTSG